MPFKEVFGLSGSNLTYRDYWTLVLGSYAGLLIVSGIAVSLLCSKLGADKDTWKPIMSTGKCKWIAAGISGLYGIVLVMLAILNGLLVFGGEPFYVYVGYLLVCQIVFTLIGTFVKLPFLALFLTSVSNWSIAGSVFFLIQLPSMFDYAPARLTWLVAVAASIPLVFKAGVTHMRITQSSVETWRGRLLVSARSVSFWLVLVLVMGIGIVLAFFLAGTCITVYDPDVNGSWVPFGGTLRWSSRLMRSKAPKSCEGSGPCHVYLTAGADLTSEVFVNVHMPMGAQRGLSIQISGGPTVLATEFETPLLDPHDVRIVYAAHLSGLAPGAEISFTLVIGSGQVGEPAYYFRTASLVESFNFVTSGDSGLTSDAVSIMDGMVAANPYLAVIGGDIVYDNGFIACACVWDQWLTSWESKRASGKYLVPLSFAAGNHDLGVNDNNFGAYLAQSGEECDPHSTVHAPPLFFSWFPFEVNSLTGEPLAVCQRTAVRKHSVGEFLNLWILDSAYTVSPEFNVDYVSRQVDPTKPPAINMAFYHVPLYSSNKEDNPLGKYLIDAWVAPLFDMHNFRLCFEHHAHTYKRTKSLLANAVSPDPALGTVYLGDGKMGIAGQAVPDSSGVFDPSPSNFFQATGTQFHFFSTQVTPDGQIQVTAIDNVGVTFDQWTN